MPALSFAIKCPIEDLQSKEWPDLEALATEVLAEAGGSSLADANAGAGSAVVHEGIDCTKTGEVVAGPLYHTRCQINHEEIEVNHTEVTVLEDDQYNLHPLIFYRLAKPLKKGSELPPIDLSKFYK